MKCITTDGLGIEGLKFCDRDAPAPGPGEVLVDVHAVSLNFRDLMVAKGLYGGVPDEPFLAGSDMCGVVAQVGEGVGALAAGDHVVNAPFRNWPAGRMRSDWARTFVGGAGVDGVLAEQIVYPAASLVKKPANLSFEEGSTLTIAGLTAWAAVVTHGLVRAGDWVLLHGTGGVSIFAAQIAHMMGARTIMTTSSKDKAEIVREKFGVAHTLNYRDDTWPQQAVKLTGGGANIVVEVAGGESLGRSIKACAYEGRVAVIGVLGGLQSSIDLVDLLHKQVTVRGIFMESAQELADFARAIEGGGLTPWIDRVFDFDDAQDAYRHLESQQHMGKVVIKMR